MGNSRGGQVFGALGTRLRGFQI